jgi:GMP synthase-like glutamine amidotransferase
MRIHYFQHVPYEGLGNIEDWIKSKKHSLTVTRFYANEALPKREEIDWLIIMGGPMGAYDDTKYHWMTEEKRFIRESISAGKKVLGICLGAQLIASALGSEIYPHIHKEIGWFPLKLTGEGIESKVLKGFPGELIAFHWHSDTFTFPKGAARLADTAACRNQAFAYKDKVVGLQFHLDVKRENIEEWVRIGANELIAEPFVQTAKQILAVEDRFAEIQKYMFKILDQMEAME